MTAAIFCLITLWTATCSDDKLAWDVEPTAVSYHIEARTVQPGVATILWSADTTEARHLIGCQPEAVALHVWAVNGAGAFSPLPAVWIWKDGDMRMLDDTNIQNGWSTPPMCGGPPTP